MTSNCKKFSQFSIDSILGSSQKGKTEKTQKHQSYLDKGKNRVDVEMVGEEDAEEEEIVEVLHDGIDKNVEKYSPNSFSNINHLTFKLPSMTPFEELTYLRMTTSILPASKSFSITHTDG